MAGGRHAPLGRGVPQGRPEGAALEEMPHPLHQPETLPRHAGPLAPPRPAPPSSSSRPSDRLLAAVLAGPSAAPPNGGSPRRIRTHGGPRGSRGPAATSGRAGGPSWRRRSRSTRSTRARSRGPRAASRRGRGAASAHVLSFHGQPWARSHCRTSKLQTMSEGDVRAGDAGVRGLQQHTACITVEADAFPPAKKEIKDVDMSPALL